VVKYRRSRWAGLVAHMSKKINTYRILVGKPERDYSEDLGEDGMILNGFYRNRMDEFGLVHLA
jgi:hypothetical protein